MKIHSDLLSNLPPHTRLWRYMDLWKFEDLLSSKQLYLTQAECFKDKLEGTLSNATKKRILGDHPVGIAAPIIAVNALMFRKYSYVSCWRIAKDFEPDRFAYYDCPSTGVAVCTTLGALERAIDPNTGFYSAPVNYMDWNAHMHKDSSFERIIFSKSYDYSHEKEHRIAIHRYSGPNCGLMTELQAHQPPVGIRIDLNLDLLDAIYIAMPRAYKVMSGDLRKVVQEAEV